MPGGAQASTQKKADYEAASASCQRGGEGFNINTTSLGH